MTQVAGALVQVHFDTGQSVSLNARNGSVERVVWRTGEQAFVLRRDGLALVKGVRVDRGVLLYTVQLLGSGEFLTVPESGLSDPPETQDPVARLIEGRFESPKSFYHRTMGHYLAVARERIGVSNISARIIPQPHQIAVAHRVLQAPRQRFLLADEVGLGKTIETGVVLQELRARGALDRVLIVVPPNITTQWLYELHYKFNERFKLYDSVRVKQERGRHPADNVWDTGRNIIVSRSFITGNEQEWEQILSVPWDMVVFDEAHHVRRQLSGGNRRSTTALYRFASQISERTRGMLFLTATPMQLHPFELYSLVELLDPALFYSYEYFEEQLQQNRQLNSVVKRLTEIQDLDADQRLQLEMDLGSLLDGTSDLASRALVSQIARDQAVDSLASQHLLSEVVIRNRKRLVGNFKKRIPHIIPVHLGDDERALYASAFRYIRSVYRGLDAKNQGFVGFMLVGYEKRLASSVYAFRRTLERRLAKLAGEGDFSALLTAEELPEADVNHVLEEYGLSIAGVGTEGREHSEAVALRQLLERARDIEEDSKYQALVECLQLVFERNVDEQVLIFTQFKDTLEYLERQLQPHWAVSTFHGGMSPSEKDGAIADFQSGEAQILVSTEAGGEGRNLQFCSTLINYDLPWNPMKVEQRIGRLDRIGQERDIHIFNFALEGTIEERVLDVLNQRIHAFEDAIGGLDPILGQMEMDVQNILLESEEDDVERALTAYADKLEAEVARARAADEALRDFIMDRRSFDPNVMGMSDATEQKRLERHSNKWSKSILKAIGADIRPIGGDRYEIRIGKNVRAELRGIRSDKYFITFSFQQALQDSQIEYGSFGHPLFDALVRYSTHEITGLATRRTLVSREHAGFRGFQINFIVTVTSLEKERRVVPIVVGCDGKYHPELTDLVLDSYDWRNRRSQFDPMTISGWEDLVENAVDGAHDLVEQQMNQEMAELQSARQGRYDAEKARIEKYCGYRQMEGLRKLRHDEEILERLRASERDQDQRVVPIWERNLENDRAYLVNIEAERERLQSELLTNLEVSYSYELLNAAWIEVVSDSIAVDTL